LNLKEKKEGGKKRNKDWSVLGWSLKTISTENPSKEQWLKSRSFFGKGEGERRLESRIRWRNLKEKPGSVGGPRKGSCKTTILVQMWGRKTAKRSDRKTG